MARSGSAGDLAPSARLVRRRGRTSRGGRVEVRARTSVEERLVATDPGEEETRGGAKSGGMRVGACSRATERRFSSWEGRGRRGLSLSRERNVECLCARPEQLRVSESERECVSARRLRCEAGTSLLLVARLLSAQSRAADLSRSSPRTLAVEHSSRYVDRTANERACQGAQGEREVRAGPEPTDSRERATAALNGLACLKRLLLSFDPRAEKAG